MCGTGEEVMLTAVPSPVFDTTKKDTIL